VADFRRVPTTTRQELAGLGREMWCVPAAEVVDVVTTSGTSGVPLVYPMTRHDLARLGRAERFCFEHAGLTSEDIVLLAVTLDRCFMAGMAYFEGLRALGAAAVRVGSGSPAMLLGLMERLGATAVISVPSFLRRVADYATGQGIDLRQSTVKKLICIGEPVREQDFELNPLGRMVREAWGGRIYSTYASTELASSLCECEHGRGGHVNPAVHHVEVLDEAGEPVAPGQVGEIVVTTLGVEALPVLRYRTGDCAFLLEEPCGCGLATPRIGPIVSRKDQMLKIKGVKVFPAAVQRTLDGISGLRDYVLVATSSAPLSDELEIVLEADGRVDLGEVRERLRGDLKVVPAVRLGTAAEIEAVRNAPHYRKRRVFVDRRDRSANG
jgi:phenylacetate-CoA ligase